MEGVAPENRWEIDELLETPLGAHPLATPQAKRDRADMIMKLSQEWG